MSKVNRFLLPSLLILVTLAGCGRSKVSKENKDNSSAKQSSGSIPVTEQAALDVASSDTIQEPKWGFIDKTGHFVILPQFESVRSFSEDLAAVEKKGEWGFIDKTGKWKIRAQFANANQFKEGLAPVFKGGKWGFINKKGDTTISIRFKSVKPFSEHLAAIEAEDNKWGFIDDTGKLIIPPTFQDAGCFEEELAPVKIDGKWGYISIASKEKNNIVIKAVYLSAESFKNGIAAVKTMPEAAIPARDAVVDRNGILTYVTPLQIQDQFAEGLALYEHHDKWGYINEEGEKVIKARYAWADKFSDQLACVRLGFKKGYIDHNGKFVLAPQFDDALPFTQGLAAILATQEQANSPLAPLPDESELETKNKK